MAIILDNSHANFIRQALLRVQENITDKETTDIINTALSFLEFSFNKSPMAVTSLCADDEEHLQKALLKFVLHVSDTSNSSRRGEDINVLPEISKLLMEFIGKRY